MTQTSKPSGALRNKPLFVIGAVGVLAILALVSFLRDSVKQPFAENRASASSTEAEPEANRLLDQVRGIQHQAGNQDNVETDNSNKDNEATVEERFDEALRLGATAAKKQALAKLGRELATSSPETAKELIKEMLEAGPNEEIFARSLLDSFIDEYSKIDPRAALDWALFLPGAIRLETYQNAVENWLKSDMSEVVDVITSLDIPSLRTDLLNITFRHLDLIPPNEAAVWAERLVTVPESRNHVQSIGKIWSRADIPAAHAWASNIPDFESRQNAFNGITDTLMRSSPEVAYEWIERFPSEGGIQAHSQYMLHDTFMPELKEGALSPPEATLPQPQP